MHCVPRQQQPSCRPVLWRCRKRTNVFTTCGVRRLDSRGCFCCSIPAFWHVCAYPSVTFERTPYVVLISVQRSVGCCYNPGSCFSIIGSVGCALLSLFSHHMSSRVLLSHSSRSVLGPSCRIVLTTSLAFLVPQDIAAFIKKEFDKKYNATWHCIVGRNFGSYVTHETKHFIYFYLGQASPKTFVRVWFAQHTWHERDGTFVVFSKSGKLLKCVHKLRRWELPRGRQHIFLSNSPWRFRRQGGVTFPSQGTTCAGVSSFCFCLGHPRIRFSAAQICVDSGKLPNTLRLSQNIPKCLSTERMSRG